MKNILELKPIGDESAKEKNKLINIALEILEYKYPLYGRFSEREEGTNIFIETNNNKNEKTEVTILEIYTENNLLYISTEFVSEEIYKKYKDTVIVGLLCDKFGRFYELSKKVDRRRWWEMTEERKKFLVEVTDLGDKNLMRIVQHELFDIDKIYVHDPKLYSYIRMALDLYEELGDVTEKIEEIIDSYNIELNQE